MPVLRSANAHTGGVDGRSTAADAHRHAGGSGGDGHVGGAQPAPRETDANALATALVARMTLEEKLPQLLNTAPAIPRLDVPAYNWWTESLHGALGALPTTNFPEPIGLAASFDEDLVQRVAAVIATEVRGLHALARQAGRTGRIGTGLNTWSPNLNIFRDPRWGRGQETYGEDPFLTARIGVAYVKGMQGDHPQWLDVVATPSVATQVVRIFFIFFPL